MSSLEPFEKLLRETITGDKLSSSRVDRVREGAALQFHQAPQLLAAILREHRAANRKNKLSSLYLFDAISRYAQDVIRKHASGFDYRNAEAPRGSKAKKGSKEALIEGATLFLEEGVMAIKEIIVSTLQSVRDDQKDKVLKVVDIWIKASTYDSSTLQSIKTEAQQEGRLVAEDDNKRSKGSSPHHRGKQFPANSPYGTMAERGSGREDRPSESKANEAAPIVPSNILAMLGGGANNNNSSANGGAKQLEADPTSGVPGLNAEQIAMLQQVTATQQPLKNKSIDVESTNEPSALRPSDASSYVPPSTSANAGSTAVTSANNNEENPTNANHKFHPDEKAGDLSQFDMSTFDPSLPASWLRFAQQWYNTYQYIPTNQELFWGLMSGMQAQMYMQSQMMQDGEMGSTMGQQMPATSYYGNISGGDNSNRDITQQFQNWR